MVIRTNGGDLKINDKRDSEPYGSVTLFGWCVKCEVTTNPSCLHVEGKVGDMDVKAGKVIAENKGIVYFSNVASGATIERANGGLVIANKDATISGTANTTPTNEAYYNISTAAELVELRLFINSGWSLDGLTVKLTNDIDLAGIAWVPIGWADDTNDYAFKGTFDGDGHKISNLSNAGVDFADLAYAPNVSSGTSGAIYGLFGVVGGTTTIKNLTLENFDIEFSAASAGKGVACLIGAAYYKNSQIPQNMDLTIYNVKLSNCSVVAGDKVGGLIGSACYKTGNTDTEQKVTIKECTLNNVIVKADNESEARAGGLLGQFGNGSDIKNTLKVEKTTISNSSIIAKNNDNKVNAAYAVCAYNNSRNYAKITMDLSGLTVTNTAAKENDNVVTDYVGTDAGNGVTYPEGISH